MDRHPRRAQVPRDTPFEAASVLVGLPGVELALQACISGPLLADHEASATLEGSILDAAAPVALDNPQLVACAAAAR